MTDAYSAIDPIDTLSLPEEVGADEGEGVDADEPGEVEEVGAFAAIDDEPAAVALTKELRPRDNISHFRANHRRQSHSLACACQCPLDTGLHVLAMHIALPRLDRMPLCATLALAPLKALASERLTNEVNQSLPVIVRALLPAVVEPLASETASSRYHALGCGSP